MTQLYIINHSVVEAFIRKENLILVSPDAGARQKTKELSDELELDAIYCTKVRNPSNGNIIDTEIPSRHVVQGSKFIIIDDICDGGRTFVELAKKLNAAGAKDLYLYVTHGIFSKGLYDLNKHFTHIFCNHTFLSEEFVRNWDHFLTVIEENQ